MYIFQIYTYKFFTRGIHEIYTPAIEQSDWSECTSHGTNIPSPRDLRDLETRRSEAVASRAGATSGLRVSIMVRHCFGGFYVI